MRGLAAGVTLVCISSCIVDDDRCDPHQVEGSSNISYDCVCAPGYVLSARGYGCEACGKHERAVAGKCECEAGYARASASAACTAKLSSDAGDDDGGAAQASELGSTCSDTQRCAAPNPYCAKTDGGSFCTTRDCTRNDDCPAEWRCVQSASGNFCGKPPSGFGMHCDTQADCAPTEARYCETFQEHVCVVNDCAAKPSDCPSQNVCCDLTPLIGTSLCVSASQLVDGACPAGAKLVTP